MSFEDKGLEVYHYQKQHNSTYRKFLEIVGKLDFRPSSLAEIPFCPVSLFKSNFIQTGEWVAEKVLLSSGTTSIERSKHAIREVSYYHQNTEYVWRQYFGELNGYEFVSLLPNYHENTSSSLLSMVAHFMKHSRSGKEQFFLNDTDSLYEFLESSRSSKHKTILIGVSFALLSYLDTYFHRDMEHLIVIETGGMKRYRDELTRSELHNRLSEGFQSALLCSEYGMTECLSQIYAIGGSQFKLNDRMHTLISDPSDPFCMLPLGRIGRVNIIDLANIDTLSFFATDDIGKMSDESHVEIIGRISNTDLRGCNYLI